MNQRVKTIAIVSLSSGILGEDFVKHEVAIGLKRLKNYGIRVKFMDNALKGREYISRHLEKRAEDLLQAYRDPDVDMIVCATGGDDTYRLFRNSHLLWPGLFTRYLRTERRNVTLFQAIF